MIPEHVFMFEMWDYPADNDLQSFLDDVHRYYLSDIAGARYSLYGRNVFFSSSTHTDGRSQLFWHIISGENYAFDDYDVIGPRIERIKWIPEILSNHIHSKVLIYEMNKRVGKKTRKRLYFLLPGQRFMIVLEEKPAHYRFITAFHIDHLSKLDEYVLEYRKYGPKI